MSHLYGSIPVSARRTMATARAHHELETHAASWDGAIRVRLERDHESGKTKFAIMQEPHHGNGIEEGIAIGIIGDPAERVRKNTRTRKRPN